MPYFGQPENIKEINKVSDASKKIQKKGRGRRKLQTEPLQLKDFFGDGVNTHANKNMGKKCSIKIYFLQDDTSLDKDSPNQEFQSRMKCFNNNANYIYPLPKECQ